FDGHDPARPHFPSWVQPDGHLVKALLPDADVFAFGYAQTAPVTEVAAQPALPAAVRWLRSAGYREVVLVGFSAGGLVARQLVEDVPGLGVTKVVQVCAPNGGSSWAKVKTGLPAGQGPFVESLTKAARAKWHEARRDRRVPDGVQFVCVVGTGLGVGDGVVTTRSQWPEDLQRQGVPAVLLHTEHLRAVRTAEGAKVIALLVREELPRWDAQQVAAMRRRMWGERAAKP
ncbi:MAG TPA: hypothetical protein VFA26_20660, partial [Gemmataceae bacterium]|nr:hypothetical protein [Gemmataceae bacterium]